MINVNNKIKKNVEFKKVYREGKSVITGNSVMIYYKNDLTYNRVGFSISKKVGNSVKRNRWKRLYWEVFRNKNKILKQGYDIVFIARKPLIKLNYKEVKNDFIRLIRKGRLKNIKKSSDG